MDEGKEYLFSGAKHVAIVRTIGKKYQYLELQSESESGWTPFEIRGYDHTFRTGKTIHVEGRTIEQTLEKRFGFNQILGSRNCLLVDIDLFKDKDEFRDLLGYINTAEDNQKKGAKGYAK